MSRLSVSLPVAQHLERLVHEPFAFLARTRAELGDAFVIKESGPIFSRSSDCKGAVSVFGVERQRQVLSDIDTFVMPMSAARKMKLPPTLVNLNRGLHSMLGDQHTTHKRLVASMLGQQLLDAQETVVPAALEAFVKSWNVGDTISLLSQMRKLTLDLSLRLLFGPRRGEAAELGPLLNVYFMLRRESSSPFSAATNAVRKELTTVGRCIDEELRRRIRQCRAVPEETNGSLLHRLAIATATGVHALNEDEIVGHANVLFMSLTEPIAVSLTWVLLVLSQLPNLRSELRQELACVTGALSLSPSMSLLDSVINETLRLLTPNALMVRVTSRPICLQGVMLPEKCEVVLCPFLAHREAERFHEPDVFIPSRWRTLKPSPYEYFPFGAGGHACVGRSLAQSIVRSALASLLKQCDLVLANNDPIDWNIQIMLTPTNDPIMKVHRADVQRPVRSPQWHGSVCELLQFRSGV